MDDILYLVAGTSELLPEYILLIRLVVFILCVETGVSLTAILYPLTKAGGRNKAY